MPINITEEFVRSLMNQNAELNVQNTAVLKQPEQLNAIVDSLNQTIKELRANKQKL